MEINKKIRLGINEYYIKVKAYYKKAKDYYTKNDMIFLLIDANGEEIYLDDLNEKIEEVESAYKAKKNSCFLDDVIYIYKSIPYIIGISYLGLSKDNTIISYDYIDKKEIEKYINDGLDK